MLVCEEFAVAERFPTLTRIARPPAKLQSLNTNTTAGQSLLASKCYAR